MLLGEELERNVRDAWLRLRKQILSDPIELQRRLARRPTDQWRSSLSIVIGRSRMRLPVAW